MATAKAQAVGLLVSREDTPGTAPTALWRTIQPNPDGIQNFGQDIVKVRRNVLSPNMTDEKGDKVGENAAWTLGHDATKDLFDYFGPGLLRSVAKVPGDEPTTMIYYPTAAADGGGSEDSFTVAADGDLNDGTIVVSRGFANPENNGVFVLEGTSGTTAIKVPTATLVAETVSPAGSAQVQVCGFQFAEGDLEIDADGNIISTTKDLTELGLIDGHEIMIGGTDAVTQFATTAYNGKAYVDGTVTTNLIPLKWRSFTPAGADDGANKTIQIFFPVMYRNVADGHADYITEPVWHFEKRDSDVGTAGAAVYMYSERTAINTFTMNMTVEEKIEVTLALLGCAITKPRLAATRKTGPSTATPAVSTELFNTMAGSLGGDMMRHRIVIAANGAELVTKVNQATLTIEHNASVQKQIGLPDGPINFGKIRPTVTCETFYEKFEVPIAIDDNTNCRYEMMVRNGDGGLSVTLPGGTLGGGMPAYAEDSPVTMGVTFMSHRDPDSNVVALIGVWPYVPRSTITVV